MTTQFETLLPCPFCGDDGDKGRQEVTQMLEGRNKFTRIICRACGAMCPEENWNQRAIQPVEPVAFLNEDAFTIWVEDTAADFPHVERENIRNFLRNAWIAGHNTCLALSTLVPPAGEKPQQ